MAIRLNTPAVLEVARDAAVTQYRLLVPHKLDESGDLKIDKAGIRLIAHISSYTAAGEEAETSALRLSMNEVPANGRDMLRQIYVWLENEAETRGLIGAGVAEPLE